MNRKSWQYSIFDKQVTARFKKLGDIGEHISEILLKEAGFKNIKNLNKIDSSNTPFYDIYAERGRNKYVISVKTRNKYENSIAGKRINSRYKLTDNPKLFSEEARLKYHSEPAWIAIAVETDKGTFDAYFGTLYMLEGNQKGIGMNEQTTSSYERLAFCRPFEKMGINKKDYVHLKNEYKQRKLNA